MTETLSNKSLVRLTMRKSFPQHLEQFAHSIDIVTDDLKAEISNLIKRYFLEILKADFYELLVAGHKTIDGVPTLRTFCSNRKEYTMEVFDGQDKGLRQTGYAFLKGSPCWVTTPTNVSLGKATEYVESWSGVTKLPPFWDPERINAKTSIIVPFSAPPKGLVVLEFRHKIEISRQAKEELLRIANSIGIILSLHETYRLQTGNSRNAIQILSDDLTREKMSPLTQPTVFLGFSGQADDSVVAAVKEVLTDAEASIGFNVVSWDEMSESGDINQQLLELMSTSTYGVLYFSEPVVSRSPLSHEYEYVDNANVIFEAGMLQALTNAPTQIPTGWIPIREKNSPHAPFDFAAQRTILIKRSKGGGINRQYLESELKKRIHSWFR